ncbi:TraB/GumN family protein [Salsuginibacillus kocurii]|uniref:TraB/GumN family protein n=1 Tax=Salsuginibacillus kocurii TaxID=427078 RepID=UPI00035E3AE0|nr:TraB/GumN family protein [Salsuginibacillus kocurii]
MKVVKAVLLTILVAVCAACTDGQKTAEPEHEGVFYKVEEGEQTVYLFGSIHIGEERMYPLDDVIEERFEEADRLAVEVNISDYETDQEITNQLMSAGLYQGEERLSDYLPEETFEHLLEELSFMPGQEDMIDQFQPWLATLMLTQQAVMTTEFDPDFGVDQYFLEQASDQDIPIDSLEDIEDQINMFTQTPQDEQIKELELTLQDMDGASEALEDLQQIWLDGNEEAIEEMRDQDGETATHDTLALDERDAHMAAEIINYLEEDNEETTFVVVGAMHLVGENSIVDQLEQHNFKVTVPSDD